MKAEVAAGEEEWFGRIAWDFSIGPTTEHRRESSG